MAKEKIVPTAEQRLNAGLRNLWYPVAASWMVAKAPVGLIRLGERIVLWRDEGGQVHAVEDRCPHRGARLSMGWNLGERVACWYHGVEVDGEGRMARVPALAKCGIEGRKFNIAYPVIEKAGAIFLWFGDEGVEPRPLTLPEEIDSEEWGQILCTAHWNCNYRYAAENVMDPMHGAYLHAVSHSMAEGDKTATMQARATDHGFIFEKTNQSGVNFDWTEFGDTGAHWQRLSIPYRKSAGPGGSFSIVGMVVPVDETSCRVFFWRCRKVQGWQRDAWRFLYRARLEGLHWDVLEQDRLILEGMKDDARDHEALYAHDAGLVRLRRLMQAEAKKQVEALAFKAETVV
ncbi:aromatic ring-hydroxylating dioxygenase subunit alpha [Sphingobium sp. TCM1]|uniref:aromatic ring-hydroxylating dioxygenase subunit alpha n=1 Tax=Sphingobium sp. TCM1 TaxID=453246 RepID=UPI000B305521